MVNPVAARIGAQAAPASTEGLPTGSERSVLADLFDHFAAEFAHDQVGARQVVSRSRLIRVGLRPWIVAGDRIDGLGFGAAGLGRCPAAGSAIGFR